MRIGHLLPSYASLARARAATLGLGGRSESASRSRVRTPPAHYFQWHIQQEQQERPSLPNQNRTYLDRQTKDMCDRLYRFYDNTTRRTESESTDSAEATTGKTHTEVNYALREARVSVGGP